MVATLAAVTTPENWKGKSKYTTSKSASKAIGFCLPKQRSKPKQKNTNHICQLLAVSFLLLNKIL